MMLISLRDQVALWPALPLYVFNECEHPRTLLTGINIRTRMFMTLLVNAPNWREPRSPPTEENL